MAIYTATTDVDALTGTTESDTFVIGADVMLQAGDAFNGGADSYNNIRLDATGAGSHSWLFYLATFQNFEAVSFSPDAAGTLTVYAYASQFGSGPNAAAIQVTGSALTSDNIDITFTAPGNYNFNTWTFSDWQAGPDGIFLRGSDAGADTIGGTSQTDDIFGGAGDDILSGNNGGDFIVGGAGNDTIDGGDGSDVIQYNSAASNFYVYLAVGGNLVVIDTTGAEGTDSVINAQYLRFVTDAVDTLTYTTNQAATASIAGPNVIQQGQGVSIIATANDADIAENDAITCAWDLDDDGQFDDSTTLSPTLTTGQLTTLGINSPGPHTVSLRVTDRAGVATTVSTTLTIEAVAAPVISSNGGGASAAVNVAENTTAVTTVVAADANTGDTVTYSISGGADSALFAIDAGTGALSFLAPQNYEAPADAGANNVYDVVVSASDGTNTDTQAIAVTVTDVADIVSGTANVDAITAGPAGGTYNLLAGDDSFAGSGAADLVTGGEGNDTVDGAGGTDTAVFAGARANYYIFTSGGNVVVHDLVGADGTDTLSNVENLQFTDGTIASTGFMSNEAPVSNAGGPYYAQVGQAVTLVGTASDPDTAEGDVITYAWDFDDDGVVGDSTELSPTLSGADITALGLGVGDHTITLRVTDAAGIARDSAVTLTIAASAAPVILSDGGGATASLNVAENTTAVTTAIAADGNLNDTVTYSITGDDAALFSTNATTGVLTFNTAPDHENPADTGADNVYNITIVASDDGALTDSQDLAITVTDVFDAVNSTAGADTVTAGSAGGTYNLLAGNDIFAGSGATDLITGGEGNDTIDGAGGADTALFADARSNYYVYTVAGNVMVQDLVGTDGTDILSNVESLQFNDGTIASLGFTDNVAPVAHSGGPYYAQSGQAVAISATASDADTPEGDVITYAWDLDADGAFDDSSALNFMLSGSDITTLGLGVGDHTITLRVTDAAGVTTDSTAILTIAASAAPVIVSNGGGATAAISVAENTTAVTTAISTDANVNDTIIYALTGADAALFTLNANTGALTFKASPDHETPADAGTDNVYNVTVTALDNGLLSDTQAIAITVTDTFDDVLGTMANDTIIAGASGGRYFGLNGDDFIAGSNGADTLAGGAGNDTLQGGGGADELDGGADTDTALYSASNGRVRVSLTASIGREGDAHKDTLQNIENVTGSAFDDIIDGNGTANTLEGLAGNDSLSGMNGNDMLSGGSGFDTLTGGAGADALDGGADIDVAMYSTSSARVRISLAAGIGREGDAHHDTLTNVENVTGSAFNDIIEGNNASNALDGANGDDVLWGLNGNDSISGGAGNDTLFGGGGADSLDGGADIDTAIYSASTARVRVSLTAGIGREGDAHFDTLTNIENLTGSAYDDLLAGDGAANVLVGEGGNDGISGMAGDDLLVGNGGADSLDGGAGVDTVSYSTSSARVRVSLAAGIGREGDANHDTLVGIENVTGSAFNDIVVGSDGANVINGLAGSDTLTGLAGADTFVFDSAFDLSNIDTITDFAAGVDLMSLCGSPFVELDLGLLASEAFCVGPAATSAEHRIIYNAETGTLSFDADGNGSSTQVQFAHLAAGLSLSSTDFWVA